MKSAILPLSMDEFKPKTDCHKTKWVKLNRLTFLISWFSKLKDIILAKTRDNVRGTSSLHIIGEKKSKYHHNLNGNNWDTKYEMILVD